MLPCRIVCILLIPVSHKHSNLTFGKTHTAYIKPIWFIHIDHVFSQWQDTLGILFYFVSQWNVTTSCFISLHDNVHTTCFFRVYLMAVAQMSWQIPKKHRKSNAKLFRAYRCKKLYFCFNRNSHDRSLGSLWNLLFAHDFGHDISEESCNPVQEICYAILLTSWNRLSSDNKNRNKCFASTQEN